jgi:acyl carrier protein
MNPTHDQILGDVLGLLGGLARDWDFDGPITAETRLFHDLAFESLDLVVLGAAVQEHFKRRFPFPELFAEIGQRDVRDLTVGEWVSFIDREMQKDSPQPVSESGR